MVEQVGKGKKIEKTEERKVHRKKGLLKKRFFKKKVHRKKDSSKKRFIEKNVQRKKRSSKKRFIERKRRFYIQQNNYSFSKYSIGKFSIRYNLIGTIERKNETHSEIYEISRKYRKSRKFQICCKSRILQV